jgi:nucleoside-diphosphate-sugar epimerase
VTGAAGFIGSNLCEQLVADGHDVIGADRFSDYYDPELKKLNAASLESLSGFELFELNLATDNLENLFSGVDIVFHLAAQAGVRSSWGDTFDTYVTDNILVTQRLLEASRNTELRKFVLASTSSVYGDAETLPTSESSPLLPISPYGLTKLCAEQLATLYMSQWGIPLTTVRYFTVYGPRQRPDMGFLKFMRAISMGTPITVYGDGTQTRDFTYVGDAAQATVSAGMIGDVGDIFNIGGGSPISVMEVITILEELMGRSAVLEFIDPQPGDAKHTAADISHAQEALNYEPSTELRDGLIEQVRWFEETYG